MNSGILEQIESISSESARFEQLMTSTRRKAYSHALMLTRNPSEAEDLLQETVVKAWKGYGTYMPDRPFLNWILRIMQRAYLDGRRRENPIRRAESLNSLISPSDGDVQELPIPDTQPTPDNVFLRAQVADLVHQALEEVPDVYREAIVGCDLEGLTYQEVADQQKTTVGTVRSRIHRGRKLLRQILLRKGALQQIEP